LLSLPGAVAGDAPDTGVAAHYGAISAEQKRLLAGGTFVDLSHRDVITVSGADRLTWLHSLTPQFLEGLAPLQWTEVLILSPQGRVEHAFTGYDDGETFWAHLEPGQGAALVAFLESMRFMMRVQVALVSTEWAVLGVNLATDGGSFEPGFQLVSRESLSEQPDRLGDPVGTWAWEAFRIEAGRARMGLDTDDNAIPNELGWIGSAVHMDKGCYRGQETVARVHTLGKPPRRLVLLHLDGVAEHLPPHGTDVMLGDKRVGFIGSTARHHELGSIALALIKRNVDPGETLTADGVAANQEIIVDPEVGLHFRPVLKS
jgi:folate-binding protein YgfZ